MDNILCSNQVAKPMIWIKNKDIGLPGIPMIHSAIDLIWANDVPALYIHVTTS